MKILDVQLFEQVFTDTQSALKEKSGQTADLQQTIDAFVNMEDAFKGKAGNAIRATFRDFHQPFLLYLQSFKFSKICHPLNRTRTAIFRKLLSQLNGQ